MYSVDKLVIVFIFISDIARRNRAGMWNRHAPKLIRRDFIECGDNPINVLQNYSFSFLTFLNNSLNITIDCVTLTQVVYLWNATLLK